MMRVTKRMRWITLMKAVVIWPSWVPKAATMMENSLICPKRRLISLRSVSV